MQTESTFLRIRCKNIDSGRLAIALAELRSIGLNCFEYENKIRDVIKYETKTTKSKIYGCKYS